MKYNGAKAFETFVNVLISFGILFMLCCTALIIAILIAYSALWILILSIPVLFAIVIGGIIGLIHP